MSSQSDPDTIIQDFFAAWNSQNIDRIVDVFTDDAEVMTPAIPGIPDTWRGKDEIRQMAGIFAPGFNGRLTGMHAHDDHIHFTATVEADALRQFDVDSVDEDNNLVIQDGKTREFVIRFTPDSTAKIMTAIQRLQGGDSLTGG